LAGASEATQGVRGFGKLSTPDEDFAGEREGADVVGLDHRDVLQSDHRRIYVASLTKHARPFPIELYDLGRVVREVEPLRDELEELLAVLPLAHTPEQPIECDLARRIASEGLAERGLGFVLLAELDEEQPGLLPEFRSSSGVSAACSQSGSGLDFCRFVSKGSCGEAGPCPRREISGVCPRCSPEGL